MHKIILASGSPRRKEILEKTGVTFTVCPSDREEITTREKPEEIVAELAAVKAEDIAERSGGDIIVIGADTMVAVNGQILGKPRDIEDAKRMLRLLGGNIHKVYTGVSVIIKDMSSTSGLRERTVNFVESTDVLVKPLTEEQIAAYVATGEPFDKAGGYAIQGRFAVNIERIDGDYNNIVGFPISRLYSTLLKEGIDILNP